MVGAHVALLVRNEKLLTTCTGQSENGFLVDEEIDGLKSRLCE